MFDFLKKDSRQPRHAGLSRVEVVALLQTSTEALAAFEASYAAIELPNDSSPFGRPRAAEAPDDQQLQHLCDRIVDELCAITEAPALTAAATAGTALVSQQDLDQVPLEARPQLTSQLAQVDIQEPASAVALLHYRNWIAQRDTAAGHRAYQAFRNSLDVLDLDPVTYYALSQNPASMGHWLPPLNQAAATTGFFRIPETTVVQVPLPILQLSRQDYASLTPATLKIVDAWAQQAFGLDPAKSYFLKTGIFSSKFDFRNAKVSDPQEVLEIGQYLLYLQHQTVAMSGPITSGTERSMYGAASTVEWVVREYIEDPESRPTIYHGMPLRTEYRVFIDADAQTVLGITPYWEPETMMDRFENWKDSAHPEHRHDAVAYSLAADRLAADYASHHQQVTDEVKKMLPALDLSGQWSLDVMASGEDYYLIDMALAETSAFYETCVPPAVRRPTEVEWLPALTS